MPPNASVVTSQSSPLRVDWFDTYCIQLLMHAGGALGLTLLPGRRGSGQSGPHHRDLDGDMRELTTTHNADVLVLLSSDAELSG